MTDIKRSNQIFLSDFVFRISKFESPIVVFESFPKKVIFETNYFRSRFDHKTYFLCFTPKTLDWLFSFFNRKPYHEKRDFFWNFRKNNPI